MVQTRWFCEDCKREWVENVSGTFVNSSPVSISGNPVGGNNCPICGSCSINIVKYNPDFPGGDIPRDNNPRKFLIPQERLPGYNPLAIRIEPNSLLINNE